MTYSVSEAAERNKGPILAILSEEFAQASRVLEIGSGTGQHALHFAAHLRHLEWQPSDTGDYLPALRESVGGARGDNLLPATEIDVRMDTWPGGPFDGVFTANTLHIMSRSSVEAFFRGVGRVLASGGTLCVYGPFRYAGRHTTQSNADFDEFLRKRDPQSGVRDFEAVDGLARQQGLMLTADHAMPANNRLLVWRRTA
jgi:SAM-dependent methyltransferase